MKLQILHSIPVALVSIASHGAEPPRAIAEAAIWEAEGIQELDALPNRAAVIQEVLLKDENLKRLVELAPRSAIARADLPFDNDALLTLISAWWIKSFVKATEEDIAAGKINARHLARELMIDRLRLACLPESVSHVGISTIRCELRNRYQEQFEKDPIRWISEYAKTMGSRHDRLAFLESTLKTPPSPVLEYNMTSLRASTVTALFENGNGKDWSSARGLDLLKEIMVADNHLGFTWALGYLATRNEEVPSELMSVIEKKIAEKYDSLHVEAKDAVMKLVRIHEFDKTSLILRTIVIADPRAEVKAEALELAFRGAGPGGVPWVENIIPDSAFLDIAKLTRAAKLSDIERLESARHLISLNDPFVSELLARISISGNWFDNRIAEMFVDADSDLSLPVAKAIAGKIAWNEREGTGILGTVLKGDKKTLREALLVSAESAAPEAIKGYGSIVTAALSEKGAARYDADEIVAMINIAASDPEKDSETGTMIEGFLNENSAIYKNRSGSDCDIIFSQSLFAMGDIPGAAPKIKSAILEGLRSDTKAGHQVAAAHALKSWPAGQPLGEDVVKAVSDVLSRKGDVMVKSRRLHHVMSRNPQENTSVKLEILGFLKNHSEEIHKFRESLKEIATTPSVAQMFTERDPAVIAKELLK